MSRPRLSREEIASRIADCEDPEVSRWDAAQRWGLPTANSVYLWCRRNDVQFVSDADKERRPIGARPPSKPRDIFTSPQPSI